jgi:EmrB/QacA subfamily drug resistance transporter
MRRPFVLAACMLAMFMAAIESTIVATAIPSIVEDLGGFRLFGWVFGAYLLAQSVTIPIYGRLADLYGRRRVLFFGAAVFLVGSTLCGFAPSMLALILFRALQGLGAGAILPIASTIIGDIYTPYERAKMQGWLSSVWGFAAVVGPLLGAFIVTSLSWSVIFWINLPVGAAAIAALAVFYPEVVQRRPHRIDFAGAALMVAAVGLLMASLLQARALGWWVLAPLALSATSFAALIAQERVASEPLLPLGLWRNRMILAGNLGSLAIGAAMMSCSAFLPVYIQGVMGLPVLAGGTALALMSTCWPIASTIGGRLMMIRSYHFNVTLGGAILLAGSVALPVSLKGGSLLGADIAAGVIGAGLGLCSSTFLVAVQSAAAQHVRGIATASTVFCRMTGSALGTAVLGAVLNLRLGGLFQGDPVQTLMDRDARAALATSELARLAAAVDGALHLVFWAGAGLALLAFALAFLTPRGINPRNVVEYGAAAPQPAGD